MALTKGSTGSVAWGESDIPTGWREADTAFMELPETASPQQLFRSLKKDLRLQEEGLALLTVSAFQHQPTRFSRLVEIGFARYVSDSLTPMPEALVDLAPELEEARQVGLQHRELARGMVLSWFDRCAGSPLILARLGDRDEPSRGVFWVLSDSRENLVPRCVSQGQVMRHPHAAVRQSQLDPTPVSGWGKLDLI